MHIARTLGPLPSVADGHLDANVLAHFVELRVNVARSGNGIWLHFQFVGDNDEEKNAYSLICAYKMCFVDFVTGRKSVRNSLSFVTVTNFNMYNVYTFACVLDTFEPWLDL